MSGVEEFRLQDKSVTSEFLDGLVVAEKGAVLLSSLKTLDLYECGFADHDEALNSILRIVGSRLLVTISRTLRPLPQIDLSLTELSLSP